MADCSVGPFSGRVRTCLRGEIHVAQDRLVLAHDGSKHAVRLSDAPALWTVGGRQDRELRGRIGRSAFRRTVCQSFADVVFLPSRF
jgi:hypothetical protein